MGNNDLISRCENCDYRKLLAAVFDIHIMTGFVERVHLMQNKEYQKLRNCPFCGGEAKTYTAYGGYAHQIIWLVHCNGCHLNYPSKQRCATELQAIEAWNRRTGDTE